MLPKRDCGEPRSLETSCHSNNRIFNNSQRADNKLRELLEAIPACILLRKNRKLSSRTMLPTSTRLRQIALVASDLDHAKHLLTNVIGTEVIFVDPGVEQWGLKNILVPIGGDIIEVVSPFRSNTPASRQLSKHGDGGYMIIMQNEDARARRRYIEDNGLAKVIYSHEGEDGVCIQYHPKGIKGGVIPELDSHNLSSTHPHPLSERFPPWHAAGPPSSYSKYSAGMKRHGDLHLLLVVLRLAVGDRDTSGAAKQWEDVFGAPRGHLEGELKFTNGKMAFIAGEASKHEGIAMITIGVSNQKRLENILREAAHQGLKVGKNGYVKMLGLMWQFVPFDNTEERRESRL